jgi:hypothetical protein
MDRAFGRDLHQFSALFRCQRTAQSDLDIDSVEHPFFGLALGAIFRMNARVAE